MREGNLSFYEFAMQAAEQTARFFKERALESATSDTYSRLAAASHRRQEAIEQADSMDFDAFLADYFRRQNA